MTQKLYSTQCHRCGAQLITKELNKYRIAYCPNYCKHGMSSSYCEHEHKQLVRVDTTIRHQCTHCAELIGYPVSTKKHNIASLPAHTELLDMIGKELNEDREAIEDFRLNYENTVQRRFEDFESEWANTYNTYLLSEKWLKKRDKVLKRDNYTCQACLERKASQVHHLNYDHVGKEPLFDLVSVCIPCHEALTKLDRERKENPPSYMVNLMREEAAIKNSK